MRGQSILRLFLPRIVAGFLIGVLYAGAWYGSPVIGGLAGALCSASFISLEQFVLRRNSGGFIRPLPFLAYFALRSVLYVGVIAFIIAVVSEASGGGIAGVRAFDLIVALVLAVGVILFLSVNDLLGPGVLFAFAAGRYHTPRIEERVLLFIDMRASTAIAERLGELRYLSLLNRFVGDVSFAVAEAGGGIHKYVGDEVIATWRLAPGANPPACVNATFAALGRIAAQGSAYQHEFGVIPDFRAGLHCGPVAVGELGSLRREIALIGDTMNTAARILEVCRDTDNRVLASAGLIDRLATLPPGVTRRRLGEFPVRGKEHRLELDVLEAEGPPKGRAENLSPGVVVVKVRQGWRASGESLQEIDQ
jgi:adenylate cyclase